MTLHDGWPEKPDASCHLMCHLEFMILRNPGAADSALETLRQLHMELSNTESTAHNVHDFQRNYIQWADRLARQYDSIFEGGELSSALLGPSYRDVQSVTTWAARPYEVMRREVKVQGDRLADVIARLTALRDFIGRPGDIIIPDTCALTHGETFTDFDWPSLLPAGSKVARVVIPIIVIDELDRLKWQNRGSGREGAIKTIRKLRETFSGKAPNEPTQLRRNTTIEILSEEPWHRRREIADDEIIVCAREIQSLVQKSVTITSTDFNMEVRAGLAKLRAATMPTAEEVREAAQAAKAAR